MPSNISSMEQVEEFQPSSSDDEYNEHEKSLLNRFRNRKRHDSESETEIFAVGSENESDDDDKSDIALSDVEGQEVDDSLPDIRAWGKEKKKYYGADYVDPDYGGFEGKDAQAAEIEEEEARNLQNQLVQQLDDNDFSLDIMFKKNEPENEKDESEELIKTDLSKLTNKQKIQILQKESPEFFGLVDDFNVKMTLAKDYLYPIIQKFKSGKIQNCNALEFVQTQYQLILNYATNIYMYLILKINKELKNHPVIKKLYQYRQLLSQMDPIFEEVIKPQIEILLNESQVSVKSADKTLQIEKRKLLRQLKESKITSDQPTKKLKLDKKIDSENIKAKKVTFKANMEVDQLGNKNKVDQIIDDDESQGTGKRAITYQIAKNKGLTPRRKKELRNPRVKHKLKFRKALIRRKGAVREPRKELSRYSGEISGIKTSVSKSIKIKS